MKNLFLIPALLAAVLFAVPASAGEVTLNLSQLEQTTVADLQAAETDATNHNDTIAANCYAGLIAYVDANGTQLSVTAPVGVASAFQDARDGVKLAETTAETGIPPAIETACGPLALDVQSDLGKAGAAGFTIFGLHL
jgi:hypothetical protein